MEEPTIDDSSISSDNVSYTLQNYIQQGQALIIFDDLDEISVPDQRFKIINIIEKFEKIKTQTPTNISAFNNAYVNKLLDDPSRSGRNQLIVPSLIVIYHAASLPRRFSRYTIRPMDSKYITDFVYYCFFRVHHHIIDMLSLQLTNQGDSHSEALKKNCNRF
ncbi:unnamed protein product [Rotaria sp. Silwood2]|nr:unnamed protein product [Rotaria sp. Silwood2]CAF4425388.1 unnamed protein product [Rotaria sp. Silwood2]